MRRQIDANTETTMSPADVLALELARAHAEWAGYPMGESVALHEIERPDLYVAMARRVIEREAALLAEVRQWKANESEVRRTADMHAKRIARITEKSKNREAALVAERDALREALEVYASTYNEYWQDGMPILEPLSDSALATARAEARKPEGGAA